MRPRWTLYRTRREDGCFAYTLFMNEANGTESEGSKFTGPNASSADSTLMRCMGLILPADISKSITYGLLQKSKAKLLTPALILPQSAPIATGWPTDDAA